MKKQLAILFVLVLLLSGCASHPAPTEATIPDQTPHTTHPIMTEQETTETPPETLPATTQETENLCYWCKEFPVEDFETYCVNCRCLICSNLRKQGKDYLYCTDHNCNESLCENPATEGSQYCTEHKCSYPNCNNRRWSGSEDCAHHK